MDTIKITKRNMFEALVTLGTTGTLCFEDPDGNVVDVTAAQLVDFANNELELLANRAAKNKERRAAKTAANDELIEAVYDAVGDDWDTIPDITARVDFDGELSVNRVMTRLSTLYKDGRIEKGEVTIPGSDGMRARKLSAYRRV